jgi:hypothetical protein
MHNFDQMVVPRAVYISQSTELGTACIRRLSYWLSEKCKEHGLNLMWMGRDWERP